MKEPLISVVIPTYNRSEMLKDALKSVLNQTFQDFEIIVCDDGSEDNTKEIVEAFKDNRIKYLWQENSGLSPAVRNMGIQASKGKYVALLDSDDIWLPNKLEKQLNAFNKNPDLLVVATNFVYFSDEKDIIISILYKTDTILNFKETLRMCTVNNSSVLIKKEVFNCIGLKDVRCRLMSDYDYWLRLLHYKDKSILVIKEILTKSRVHQSNTFLKSRDFLEKFKTWRYIYGKHKNYNPEYIISNLRWRVHQYKCLKLENLISNGRSKLTEILNSKELKFNEKFIFTLKHLKKQYIRKSNFFMNLLLRLFHYYIFKIVKRDKFL